MSKRTQYHVTKGSSNWKITKAGAERATCVRDNKADAVKVGREIAKQSPSGQLIIHKGDGTIQTEHTYGNDPYPPKG